MNLISEDYLMHHGVKGMKWGVRHDKDYGKRFVKSDGSLTRRGQKKQARIDRKIRNYKSVLEGQKKALSEYDKANKLFTDSKRKKEAVEYAMRRDYGVDYKDKDYLELIQEKSYKQIQNESYNRVKKYYTDPKHKKNMKRAIEYQSNWLKKNGNKKISDIKTKEEYRKFTSSEFYDIDGDKWKVY